MGLEVDFKSRASIGELARAAGVQASAIRYYESIGLLPRAERSSGRRVYGRDALVRLRRIRLAQESGFSLDEIKVLERGFSREGPPPERWRRLAMTKLVEVEAQLGQLQAMRTLLHDTLRCPCVALADCPLVGRALMQAGQSSRPSTLRNQSGP